MFIQYFVLILKNSNNFIVTKYEQQEITKFANLSMQLQQQQGQQGIEQLDLHHQQNQYNPNSNHHQN